MGRETTPASYLTPGEWQEIKALQKNTSELKNSKLCYSTEEVFAALSKAAASIIDTSS